MRAVEDTPSCRLADNVAPALSTELGVPVTLLHLVPEHASPHEEQQATQWLEELTRDPFFELVGAIVFWVVIRDFSVQVFSSQET